MSDERKFVDKSNLETFLEEHDIKIDEKLSTKIDIAQGEENAGKILTIDETGNTVLASQTQADWDVTDESNAGFIQNKPFGETDEIITVENILMDSLTLTNFVKDEYDDYYSSGTSEVIFEIKADDVYKIILDGEVYDNIVPIYESHFNYYSLGDVYYNEYPFYIFSNNRGTAVRTSIDGDSHTVSIIKCEQENKIVKIDEKFIPDSVKTHYDNRKFTEILNDCTFTTEASGIDICVGMTEIFDFDGKILEGQMVEVVYDGVAYQGEFGCAYYTIDGMQMEVIYFGNSKNMKAAIDSMQSNGIGAENISITNPNDNCPFTIKPMKYENSFLIYIEGTEPSTHTISVSLIDGELKQLDEKFIPDSVKAQPDWNVNDIASTSYIQNRPFYTTDPQPVELCNGTFEFNNSSGIVDNPSAFYESSAISYDESELVVNKEITIAYDGTTYNNLILTEAIVEYNGQTMPFGLYAGNGAILAEYLTTMFSGMTVPLEDTGEPFVLSLLSGSSAIITKDKASTHDISISVVKPVDITISQKYLGFPVWAGEGKNSIIIGDENGVASGEYTVCEGTGNKAIGVCSHAEGYFNEATGNCSHAEGKKTKATGNYSHAEGYHNIVSGRYQHVQGRYNIEDAEDKYAHIVGNGTSDSSRSNAHTVDWDGNAEYAGDVIANACGGENPISLVETANKTVMFVNVTLKNIETASEDEIMTADVDRTFVADKTFAEIKEHFDNGGTVIATYAVDGLTLPMYGYDDSTFVFLSNTVSSRHTITTFGGRASYGITEYRIMITSDDSVILQIADLMLDGTEIPSLETDDKTVIGSINELNDKIAQNETDISSLQEVVSSTALVLSSPNGTRFSITVGDDGILTATEVTE